MKRFYVIIISLLLTSSVVAQEDDKSLQICLKAEEAYNIGQFDIAIQQLNDNLSIFSNRVKGTALRLLSLCYLAQDQKDKAEEYAKMLLASNPYYVSTLSDPVRFSDMIERLKNNQDLITTASLQRETVEESPIPVTLITEDMIKASGAKNLRDLLTTYVPGITSIEGEECNISMRGVYSFTQENIMIMRDGHRLNSFATNSIAPDYRIALNNIKQIEVLRGPASSLYGGVALSSVVNIITKKGSEINGLKASFGIGDNNTYKGELLMGKHFIDTDISLWGSVYSSNGYNYFIPKESQDHYGIINKDGSIYVDGYNRRPAYDLGLKYRWKELTFSLSHQHGKRVPSYNNVYLFSPYDYDKYSSVNGTKPGRSTTSTNANIDYYSAFNDNTSLSTTLSFNYETTDIYNVLGDSLSGYFSNISKMVKPLINSYIKDSIIIGNGAFAIQGWSNVNVEGMIHLSHNYRLGKSHGNILLGTQVDYFNSYYNYLSVGENYEHVILTALNDENIIYKNGRETTLSFFGQIKHYISPKLIINGGIRYDYKKRYDDRKMSEWSPRLAFIYVPSNKWNVKLSYAHSFVDASFFYRVSDILYLGNPDLDPQHMDSYQLSSSVNLFPGLAYNGNIFYNHASIMSSSVGFRRTSGKFDMLGLENTLAYKDKHSVANASIIFQKKVEAKNYTTKGKHVNAVPDFVCNLIMGREVYRLVKNLWLETKVSYNSKQTGYIVKNYLHEGDAQYMNEPYEIPSLFLWDAGIRYVRYWGEFGFRCYNIINTKYRLGGHLAPILQPGRTFMASFTINLK